MTPASKNHHVEAAPEYALSEKKDGILEAHPPRSMLKNLVLIGTVTLAMILNTANTTAVFISLPTIGEDLNISESNLQWIISAYALSSSAVSDVRADMVSSSPSFDGKDRTQVVLSDDERDLDSVNRGACKK
ncbi:hypothetical protein C8T65DRAFT_834829 [Cerioporus squamosus]|nr:hypothetical protein C8T65DRAFT_834829 [Cerioporus squamosus]